METTIQTLVENTVWQTGLTAEHGLSFLIRADGGTVLFDTGAGPTAVANASRLEADLTQVDRIVLSHGHYDHTGGLEAALEQMGPRDVLLHPDALLPKQAVRKGNTRDIGMPFESRDLERAGARFVLVTEPTEVVRGVTATGPVPRVTDFESVGSHFRTRRGDRSVHDDIVDDQSLIVRTGQGLVLVLGCAHAGLINTLRHAADVAGQRRFACVVGGTHLVDADADRIAKTIEALREFQIERLAPCHCTGFEGQVALRNAVGDRFRLNATGDRLAFA